MQSPLSFTPPVEVRKKTKPKFELRAAVQIQNTRVPRFLRRQFYGV